MKNSSNSSKAEKVVVAPLTTDENKKIAKLLKQFNASSEHNNQDNQNGDKKDNKSGSSSKRKWAKKEEQGDTIKGEKLNFGNIKEELNDIVNGLEQFSTTTFADPIKFNKESWTKKVQASRGAGQYSRDDLDVKNKWRNMVKGRAAQYGRYNESHT